MNYLEKHSELTILKKKSDFIKVKQPDDQMNLTISFSEIDSTYVQIDSLGKKYLQINLNDGGRLLLTQRVIGFEAKKDSRLRSGFLPDVVTTLDLLNIMEAFESSLRDGHQSEEEQYLLNKAFRAIAKGATRIGFNVSHLHSPFLTFSINSPILH